MMKDKRTLGISLAVFGALAIGLVIGLVSISGMSFQISSYFGTDSNAEISEPADDPNGALEYEFNMLKDPTTGKIPEGSFDAERTQANDILQRQGKMRIPEFASYNFVGPDNLGGRTRSVVYDVRYNGAGNRTILAAGVSGGVYKSVDDGATWTRKSPTGDHFSCTSLAQDPRPGFQDTWYYATGENGGSSAGAVGATYFGNGVYKSTDNGETWARLPNSNTTALETFSTNADLINKIIVDPTNGNIYIATLAAIIRSTDGGANWENVLEGTLANAEQTTDIIVTSNGTFYAAFSGSNTAAVDGVHKSTSGASGSWTKIAGTGSATTPAGWNAGGAYGRVVLAIAPNLESRVYVLYDDNTKVVCPTVMNPATPKPEAEFFYWNDLNQTWTDISATLPDEPGCSAGNDPFGHQGGYDLVVAVKPDDANTVFIGSTNVYRSNNAGVTWTRIGGYDNPNNAAQYANSHSDIHWFVFQPGSPTTMLCGNDGGIQRTTDNMATNPRVAWTPINNGFRTYQYYYVANDPRAGNNKVIGGAQDNGTTRNIGGTGSAFELIFSGDGVSVGLSDPAASGGVQYEYVGVQQGPIYRREATDPGSTGTLITPNGESGGLFITLFKLDSDNTERLYYVNKNRMYRTTSASTVTPSTWTAMSGVETAVGSTPFAPEATPINITAVGLTRGAYNPASSKLFFGTQDARVFRLNDPTGAAASATPVNISGAGFPAGAYVSSIAVSPTNSNEVLVTFSNYGVASVFWTNNADAATPTWQNVENNLPLPSYRSSAILTINGTTEYFVGTSTGLYRIVGSPVGGTWIKEGPTTIGNAVVSSLDSRISDNKLLVGTHGIGMLSAAAPTAATVSVSGRVLTPTGTGLRNAIVTLNDETGTPRTARTSGFGYYRFDDVPAGGSVVVSVSSKIYRFEAQALSVTGEVNNLDFIASK